MKRNLKNTRKKQAVKETKAEDKIDIDDELNDPAKKESAEKGEKRQGKFKLKLPKAIKLPRPPKPAEIVAWAKKTIHLIRTSSRFRHGSMATVVTAVFFVFLILVNVISGVMSDKYAFMTLDMTAEGLYTLSDTTLELLESIDEVVEIDILATEEQCTTASALIDDTYGQIPVAHEIIKRYAQMNDNITINYVDLSKTPAYIQQFPEYSDTLDYYSIVIKSTKRTRVTSFYEMLPSLSSSYSYYYDSTTESDTEAQSYTETYMTSLIKTVTMDKTPVVAFVSGIDVDGNSSDLVTILQLNGYDVEVVDIRKDDFPEDTDIVMIAAPTTDLTQAQMQKLDEFLNDESGDKTLLVFSSSLMPELPNLNSLLEEYGISITQDIVYEGDDSYTISTNSSSFMAQIIENDYTTDILDNLNYPAVSSAVALELMYEQKGNTSVSAVLTSTDEGYICSSSETFNESDYTEDDQDTRILMASSTTYRDTLDGSELRTDVIVVPDSIYATDYLGTSIYGNLSLMMSVFDQRSGIDEGTIDIEAKSIYAVDFSVDTQTLTILSAIFGYIIPIIVLGMGMVMYVRRKRL